MSEERIDFVVLGASGFTGQFVVDEVARVIEEEGGNLKMAVAGRSMEKLQKVLSESSQRTGLNLEEKPIIICDVTSEESLAEMSKQAKVVLNCVGPYRFYGEQVVKACIENGAHHLDISGEPQYLERMQLLYSGKAREEDIYVVGACGFDSVPSDMGVAFLTEKFDGDLNSVEFFVTLHPGPDGLSGNITTLESALHGIAHAGELKPLRKTLFPTPLPQSQYKLQPKSAGFNKDIGHWCLNFPGSDRAIVNRSVRFDYEVNQKRPFQVGAYIQLPSFFYMVLTVIFGFIIGLMAKFSIGRSLVLKYPQIFTFGVFKHGGPSKKQIESSGFSITLIGKGWKDKLTDVDSQHDTPPDSKITVRVSGPEAGYVTTPIAMVQCALTLLKEVSKDKMSGGVYTTAALFRGTSLIDRLTKHNLKYEVVTEQGPI
ncbi:saccharopine dehydrogenase-like oxidoreductase [Mercenaria mercenaria]|uniref:saccharopine dehydrogenase-like oxidoreductase n=1 Tax=Mercenaria mercenaria TaxID=6596 RepID=UPI00234E90B4|nr:saccharopine dehydrogenase-like oxidoreductase [Mercenaria mercenaria]